MALHIHSWYGFWSLSPLAGPAPGGSLDRFPAARYALISDVARHPSAHRYWLVGHAVDCSKVIILPPQLESPVPLTSI